MGTKGRKASLSLASFHAESLGHGVTKQVTDKCKSIKKARKKRKGRKSTRFYLATCEYVSTGPVKREPNEYSLMADIHVGWTLLPNKDDKGCRIPGFHKSGGRQFRADTHPMPLEDGRKWLRKSFLSWCKKYGYGDKWTFHFKSDRDAKTLTMAVEKVY
jgi:hypothetical protein